MASHQESDPNLGIVSITKFAADRGIYPQSAQEADDLIKAYEAERRLRLMGVSLAAGKLASMPEVHTIEAEAA